MSNTIREDIERTIELRSADSALLWAVEVCEKHRYWFKLVYEPNKGKWEATAQAYRHSGLFAADNEDPKKAILRTVVQVVEREES